jgi:hypothetical protein
MRLRREREGERERERERERKREREYVSPSYQQAIASFPQVEWQRVTESILEDLPP